MAVCSFHRRSLRQLPHSLSEIADTGEDVPLSTDRIEEFHACFNFLACVPDHFFLPAAHSLTHLFLCCNNLTAVPALDTPLLTELSLACNKITKMEHLDRLPHLVRLDLRANRICRLEGLSTNTQLCSLSLSGNHVEDVCRKELPRLDHLAFLGIQGNMLSFADLVVAMEMAPHLKELSAGGNPFSLGQPLGLVSIQTNYRFCKKGDTKSHVESCDLDNYIHSFMDNPRHGVEQCRGCHLMNIRSYIVQHLTELQVLDSETLIR